MGHYNQISGDISTEKVRDLGFIHKYGLKGMWSTKKHQKSRKKAKKIAR